GTLGQLLELHGQRARTTHVCRSRSPRSVRRLDRDGPLRDHVVEVLVAIDAREPERHRGVDVPASRSKENEPQENEASRSSRYVGTTPNTVSNQDTARPTSRTLAWTWFSLGCST